MVLIWPFPWHLPIPPQLPVSTLIAEPGITMRRKTYEINYTQMHYIHLFRMRDTPLRSLYRLYEYTCNRIPNEIMEEGMYFFHYQTGWRVKDIPDLKDSDPLRYIILACLAEALVEAFNFKIKLGLRRGITHDKPLLIPLFREELEPPYEEPPIGVPGSSPWKRRWLSFPALLNPPILGSVSAI